MRAGAGGKDEVREHISSFLKRGLSLSGDPSPKINVNLKNI